jgi:ribose 5-phosphate isomerase B
MKLKVAFACDHRGVQIKKQIIDILRSKGYDVDDCGTDSEESVDYADFMFRAAEKVSRGECFRAIGVCYTGIGSTIAANKVLGVRAALVHTVEEAKLSRAHNDSNMLILGAGFLDPKLVNGIICEWLATPFEGGRHEQRVNKIKSYEQNHVC